MIFHVLDTPGRRHDGDARYFIEFENVSEMRGLLYLIENGNKDLKFMSPWMDLSEKLRMHLETLLKNKIIPKL